MVPSFSNHPHIEKHHHLVGTLFNCQPWNPPAISLRQGSAVASWQLTVGICGIWVFQTFPAIFGAHIRLYPFCLGIPSLFIVTSYAFSGCKPCRCTDFKAVSERGRGVAKRCHLPGVFLHDEYSNIFQLFGRG